MPLHDRLVYGRNHLECVTRSVLVVSEKHSDVTSHRGQKTRATSAAGKQYHGRVKITDIPCGVKVQPRPDPRLAEVSIGLADLGPLTHDLVVSTCTLREIRERITVGQL